MPKIRKEKPLLHKLIVDTNVLWHKDKSYPVNPDFDQFWEEYSPQISLELIIPDIVVGEILFQQTTSAIKLLNKINEAVHDIESITRGTHAHRITEEKIKKQISAKLMSWIKSRNGSIESTPVSSINWVSIIQSSIWRLPPFDDDPKNLENEKGFRDALILETLIDTSDSDKYSGPGCLDRFLSLF